MAKSKKEKAEILDKYIQKVKGSKAVILVKSKGLLANETTGIKKEFHDNGTSFNVIKNTLFKIALDKNSLEPEESLEFGAHAAIFIGGEDLVAPSKILKKFSDEIKSLDGDSKIEVITGYLDGVKLTKEQVIELAEMPDKAGSISMILGVLDNAISGVLNVIEDPIRSQLQIIDLAFNKGN